jgi:hypothetical protein
VTGRIPRYAIMPSRDRHSWVAVLVKSLVPLCDAVLVLDNGSDPPLSVAELTPDGPGGRVEVIQDAEQPPNLARFWNVLFDRCAALAGAPAWDVAVLNDDALVPAGWLEITAAALREHPTAAVAHTGAGPRVAKLELRGGEDRSNAFDTRMCPHAFVVRGELGLRADESMRWWYFDTDFEWQARQAGGVLSVPGPRAANALANTTTFGVLQEQAEKDKVSFEAKWGLTL